MTITTREVRIPSGDATLSGELAAPAGTEALVLFADASGRHSALGRHVAQALHAAGMGTLLLDVPSVGDEPLRLHAAFQDAALWAGEQPGLRDAALGLLGAGAGSAAALIVAARLGTGVSAVVTLGGRPDLAGPAVLAAVKASTLLIASGTDRAAAALASEAYARLRCERSLTEEGHPERAAERAAGWFTAHMALDTQDA